MTTEEMRERVRTTPPDEYGHVILGPDDFLKYEYCGRCGRVKPLRGWTKPCSGSWGKLALREETNT